MLWKTKLGVDLHENLNLNFGYLIVSDMFLLLHLTHDGNTKKCLVIK